MIIGFKERFKNLILTGTKIHTIREDKHNRWCAGRILHMATGVRTKRYECFKEAVCISIQDIEITWDDCIVVSIDGKTFALLTKYDEAFDIGERELLELARNDGFESITDFLSFFKGDFTGKIIHWTDLKY
ncbi:MAG TPA: hypothetical protein DDW85_00770 [Porphyromonadaceae bacterium]|nr:hypothetical protein [Porphyromonadaceae bacterium]